MEKLYLDLAIVLFFLAALLLIAWGRTQSNLKGKISFNLISLGVCCLSLMSLMTLIQNQTVEQFLIPTAAIAAVELTRLVLLVSGLVFLTAGISKWLPSLGIKEEKDESRILRIGQLKFLGRILSSQSSLDEFLRESLEAIADNLRITAGAVYAVSDTKGYANLMASCGELNNSAGISEKFIVKTDWLKELSPVKLTAADISFSEIHSKATGLCYCFPILAGTGRTFLYLLWTKDKTKAETFDPYILQCLTNSVNARVSTERKVLSNDFNRMAGEYAHSLRNRIAAEQSANEMLSCIMNDLQNYMPVDFISICIMNGDGTGRRISIGRSGTVLSEVDVRLGLPNSYLHKVIESQRGVHYRNMAGEKEVTFPELISVSRLESLLAIPLIGVAGTKGVLSVGCGRPGAYHRVDLEFLNRITPAIEIAFNELVLEKQSEVVHEREKLLKEFAAHAKTELENEGQLRGMRSQVKSSLSSIIGSLDMIKSGEPHNEIRKDKFLAIIDKSARKLNEYLSD